ncbi:MAG TPA: AAA family ATPase [Aquabacterium sp.]|nr:AAA family ATPase [Aquabacterium sp.]
MQTLQRQLQARLLETHISWVLLDGQWAWKIKKPVHLSFLDATDLHTRRFWCEEELRLNRRLAPDLYQDVVPIGGTPDHPLIQGGDRPIEFAVRMRQFEQKDLLSQRVQRDAIQGEDLDVFARNLVRFHAAAAHASADSDWGAPGLIEQAMQGVLQGLAPHLGETWLADWTAWAEDQAQGLRPHWLLRRQSGRIVEGHGDLHLDNLLVWQGTITAFDGIEFDPALRWIDVMSDVAFLVADLAAHDRPDLAFRFLNAYLDASGDHDGLPVLRYNLVYRCLVRALVHRLRPSRDATQAQPDYLRWAHHWRDPQPSTLWIMHGLSGSGKSWASQQWLQTHQAIRLRSDVERQRLFGTGAYTPIQTQHTYQRLWDLADQSLTAGWNTVVDATFLHRANRDHFRGLARRHSVGFGILHCDAPDAVLRERILLRRRGGLDASEADEAVLTAQRQHEERLGPDEQTFVRFLT